MGAHRVNAASVAPEGAPRPCPPAGAPRPCPLAVAGSSPVMIPAVRTAALGVSPTSTTRY